MSGPIKIGEKIKPVLGFEKADARTQEIGEFAPDVIDHLGSKWDAVLGKHRVEFRRGNNHRETLEETITSFTIAQSGNRRSRSIR